MPSIESVKQKVQRILTDHLGKIEIDRDGDYVVRHESAVAYIRIGEGFGEDGVHLRVMVPLIVDVKITNELCRWIATEGQDFMIGGCFLNPNDDDKTGWVYFKYGITADDLDESELINAVFAAAATGNQLDNELRDRFGGELFGRE